jgi:hypothetical protein
LVDIVVGVFSVGLSGLGGSQIPAFGGISGGGIAQSGNKNPPLILCSSLDLRNLIFPPA